MTNIIDISSRRPYLYVAKLCSADTIFGEFEAAGTLCGCVDFVVPNAGTFTLTAEEAVAVISMLQSSLDDVVTNSRPFSDPRIVD